MTTNDYFNLIPTAIKVTRLPASDDTNPGWVLPSIFILVVLNILAVVMLMLNTGS